MPRALMNWSGTARKLLVGFGALVCTFAVASWVTLAGLGQIHRAIERTRREEEGVRVALELASAVRDQYAHQAHTIIIANESHLGFYSAAERRVLELTRALRPLARRVVVIADVEAAWHATLGDGAGILLLAGTGSIVLGRSAGGRWARAGGLGPLLGDEGSGFSIGRAWLRAGADARTQRRFATRPDAVAAIAALAPGVLARAQRGDRVASRVVREAQAALAQQAREVARTLALRGVVTAGGAGSVMRDPWFTAGVRRALAREGLDVRWRAASGTPVEAAARLAAALHTTRGRAARG
jgi:N-acetylglucosamine kinase-like BadF-type ATPase